MRSRTERIVHTVLFEVLAVAVTAPLVGLATGAPLFDAGLLSLLASVGAMALNYIWTMALDRLVSTRRRGLRLRVIQALGFELLLMVYTLPLILVFTGVSFWTAAMVDMSGVAFFAVFGMAYNAAFDAVMLRLAPDPVRGGRPS